MKGQGQGWLVDACCVPSPNSGQPLALGTMHGVGYGSEVFPSLLPTGCKMMHSHFWLPRQILFLLSGQQLTEPQRVPCIWR